MIAYPKPKPKKKTKPDYKAIYREIWQERPHECSNCGVGIPYPVVHNFSHIRSKGARPDLKEDKENIELLCSTVNRQDGEIGCHESVHSSNSEAYKQRSK